MSVNNQCFTYRVDRQSVHSTLYLLDGLSPRINQKVSYGVAIDNVRIGNLRKNFEYIVGLGLEVRIRKFERENVEPPRYELTYTEDDQASLGTAYGKISIGSFELSSREETM